jgi:hypothetical protein
MTEARRAARPERARSPASDAAGSVRETWRRLNFEQRVASVAALLLIVSTFGPFSFVEAAMVLTAVGVLALVRQRADRKQFHLPFGDGTVIFAAGLWSGFLILVRLFDRPLGQSVLAGACAAILAGAGARERAKRPPDDLPPAPEPPRQREARRAMERRAPSPPDSDPTARLPPGEDATERLSVRDAPTEERRRADVEEPEPPANSS